MSNEQQLASIPKGVVGIFTSPKGEVYASVAEFDQAKFAGFSLLQAQRIRAKKLLAHEVAIAFCSSSYVEAMESCDKEKVFNSLLRKGYTATFLPVVYSEQELGV